MKKNLQNTYLRLLLLLFTVGLSLGISLNPNLKDADAPTEIHSSLKEFCVGQSQTNVIGLIDYQKLQLQMSLTDVRSILPGNGVETSQNGSQLNMIWQNCDESYIKVIFQKGLLIEKKQFKLK